MVEALLAALDQKDLVLIAPLAAEGQRVVALGREQAEGRIEAPASLEIGDGERIAESDWTAMACLRPKCQSNARLFSPQGQGDSRCHRP
jgi:hypothetical protein